MVKADFDMYAGLAKLMIVLVVYMITSIMGLSSVGLEGKGAWMLFASPVPLRSILGAKWFVSFAVSLAIAVVLSLINAAAFHWSLATFLTCLGLLTGICFALSGVGVGLSGLFPRFLFDNPAHRASVWAMMLGFVISTFYLAMAGSGAVVAFLLIAHGADAQRTVIGSWIYFLIITLAFGIIPLRAAQTRLAAYQWEL
jgi:hypothetical protein